METLRVERDGPMLVDQRLFGGTSHQRSIKGQSSIGARIGKALGAPRLEYPGKGANPELYRDARQAALLDPRPSRYKRSRDCLVRRVEVASFIRIHFRQGCHRILHPLQVQPIFVHHTNEVDRGLFDSVHPFCYASQIMGINDFRLRLVGAQFDNEDGSSRQEELSRCVVGDPVELVREPDNPHDPSAVAVYSCRRVQIGYIGADRTAWIGSKLDRGYPVRAIIGAIGGGKRTGLPLTAVLALNMEGEEPDGP